MTDLNSLTLPRLFETLASGGLIRRVLELARDEDLGAIGTQPAFRGDITSAAAIPEDARLEASLVVRGGGVVAGLEAAPKLLGVFGARCTFHPEAGDGDTATPHQCLGVLAGPARDVLTIERTFLNLIGRLSGVATMTARFVRAVQGTNAAIYDTRKTTPGMRALEKYAVRCGGGRLHRLGLADAALFKDNHIAGVAASDLGPRLAEASRRARRLAPGLAFVEAEVDSLDQLAAALSVEPGLIDVVLLDNMPPTMLRQAVAMRREAGSRVALEASGGATLETVRAIADTGVERIAVGAITHSAPALDVGLDIR